MARSLLKSLVTRPAPVAGILRRGVGGDVGESAVAIVAPESVARGCGVWGVSDVEIEIAVVVVVDERCADATFFAADADFFGDVYKLSVGLVVEEMDSVGEADGEIGAAVVVKVARGAAEAAARKFDTGLLGDILEAPVADVVKKMACAISGADEEEIGFAVAIEIKKTCAGAGADGCADILRREMHGDGGRDGERGIGDQFGEREAALIAVACAERSAEVIGGDVLKFGEVFAGRGGVPFALVGAGDAEFGGGVIGIEREAFLIGGDGFIVFLELGIQVADEIIGVGFVGDELGDVFESGDAVSEVGEIFVGEAEVVPGVGIVGELFGGGEEFVAGGFGFLLVKQRDAEIQAGYGEFRVGLESLLKEFLSVGGALLIEVGDT